MNPVPGAVFFAFAIAIAAAAACSTAPHQVSPSGVAGPTEDGTGTVGLQYTLPGGEHVSTVGYTLTNATNTYTGSVNVAGSSTISFIVGGVAAGDGYTITLTATSDDGTVTCSGSAGPFSVSARATTTVNVNLICQTTGNDAGGVLVNAPTSNCPVWNTIVANPSGTCIGRPNITLTAAARGPDPGGLTFTWTTTGSATITNNVSTLTADGLGKNDTATFTCPAAGGETDTVTLVVGDGPVPDGGACPTSGTTGTVTVTCGACGHCTLPGESGVVASPDAPGGTCGPDPANGKPMVNNGPADANGDFCCVDACGGGPTATPFGPTGSCPPPLMNDGTGCCIGLQPCKTAGQTNCVQCQLNDTGSLANKTCTPTEAQIVAYDIKQGRATAAGPDPAGSCYTCLAQNGCIDDTHLGDTNLECDDPVITVGTGPQCHAIIDCIFASNMGMGTCAKTAVAVCYCGSASLTTTCQGNPSEANGFCEAPIAAGIGFPTADGTDVTSHFTDPARAGGVAINIFSCAHANSCTACFD
jgi:hypothetical protein